MEEIKDYSQVEFQLFQNVKSPKVLGTRNHLELFREIREGGPNRTRILNARRLGKNDPGFDLVKSNTPTYTPNALFTGRRQETNFYEGTGLIYLDIDGTTDIHLSHPLIYASYLSFSGSGRTVLVKVKGLNSENIKDVYTVVAKQLGVVADEKCAQLSRQVILSYDPQLYHNSNSLKFDANQAFRVVEQEENTNKPLLISSPPLGSGLLGSNQGRKLRWNNTDEVDLNGEPYLFLDQTIDIIEVFIPRKIREGKRHFTISAILASLLYLNPWLSYTRLEKLAFQINSRCDIPLPIPQIRRIVRGTIKELKDGTLRPKWYRPRRVIFSGECPKKLLNQMRGKASGLSRVENSIEKLNNALTNYDYDHGKPTNRKLAEIAGLSKNTVAKHLSQNDDLKRLRLEVKQEISRRMREEKREGKSQKKG